MKNDSVKGMDCGEPARNSWEVAEILVLLNCPFRHALRYRRSQFKAWPVLPDASFSQNIFSGTESMNKLLASLVAGLLSVGAFAQAAAPAAVPAPVAPAIQPVPAAAPAAPAAREVKKAKAPGKKATKAKKARKAKKTAKK
jgi:hypothetical protein